MIPRLSPYLTRPGPFHRARCRLWLAIVFTWASVDLARRATRPWWDAPGVEAACFSPAILVFTLR